MPDSKNIESLKVNGAVVTDKEEMRKAIKEFWEEIGGVVLVEVIKYYFDMYNLR